MLHLQIKIKLKNLELAADRAKPSHAADVDGILYINELEILQLRIVKTSVSVC